MTAGRPDVPGFEELGDIDAANVVRCARVLLRRPLLHPGSPDGDLLPMMYRQRTALQELFATLLGYRLVVQRRFARLYKPGPGGDPTRGARSLSPRAYAYLALTLATLTGVGQQVLLSRLVSDVRAAAGEAGVAVTDDPADRRALAAALRHLVASGLISETEGGVSPLANDPAAEALITVDTDVLGQIVAGPLKEAGSAPELIHLADGTAPTAPVEHSVRRRLVENPVVHYGDLPEDHATWLRRHHAREARLLERYFGLVTETRQEGIAITDPEDYLTDVVFPGPGTVARIALLALPELLERCPGRDRDNRHPVGPRDLEEVCAELVEHYPAAWSRQATEDIGELAGAVTDLLRRLDLLVLDEEGATGTEGTERWLLSPSAHRWVPHPDASPAAPGRAPEPEPPQPWGMSLFDELEGNGQG